MNAAVRDAHAVLHLAMETPVPQHRAVEAAIVNLGDALEAYEELDSCALSWEFAYPELLDQADPDEAALEMAAAEVEAVAEDLMKAMAAHCGITAGGDAGTEDEMAIPGVGKNE